MTPCPSPEAVARAAAEPDAAPTDVLSHIAACPRCREHLDPPHTPIRWEWLADYEPHTAADPPTVEFLQRLKAAVRTAAPGGPGPDIPGYRIEHEIARGGMGVVYRATEVKLDRPVAVKVLPPDTAPDPDRLARFVREAKALAALSHPNVVQLYQAGEASGQPYLAMEFVPGGTLRQSLRAGQWGIDESARLIRALADAADAAHRLGIIHRDIKPGNVLLNAECGVRNAESKPDEGHAQHSAFRTLHSAMVPKLADFGLVRIRDGADWHTATGEVLGTPEYMAPEQALGRADRLGPATDVWALGAVLYEALAGRPAFTGPTRADIVRRVTGSDPVPVDHMRPEVPPDLAAVCAKCLEKDPRRRYPTAAALRDDLDRYLAGKGVAARPRTRFGRARDYTRKHPLRALAAAAVVLIPAELAAGAAWSWQKARAERRAGRAEIDGVRGRFAAAVADLYAVRIRLANEAEIDGRTDEAAALLALCKPAAGDPDPRGWEWTYLRNRLRNPGPVELKKADAAGLGLPPPPPSTEAVIPDGTRKAVADPAGGVELRDAADRPLLRLPVPGGGKVVGLHFSSDGRWLAARTADDSVIVFDGAPGGLMGEDAATAPR